MNVANVTTLDIPVVVLGPLEQAVIYASRSNILVYFWISFRTFPLILTILVIFCFELHSNDRQPENFQEELMEQLDIYHSSSFLKGTMKNGRC